MHTRMQDIFVGTVSHMSSAFALQISLGEGRAMFPSITIIPTNKLASQTASVESREYHGFWAPPTGSVPMLGGILERDEAPDVLMSEASWGRKKKSPCFNF